MTLTYLCLYTQNGFPLGLALAPSLKSSHIYCDYCCDQAEIYQCTFFPSCPIALYLPSPPISAFGVEYFYASISPSFLVY